MKYSRSCRSLSFVVLLACAAWVAPPAGFSQSSTEISLAPVNPDFRNYLRDSDGVRILSQTAEGHPLGWIPSPLDLSHFRGQAVSSTFQLLGYPTSYDLRIQGKVTPVKDQGDCGSCWAFATFGSLESNLITSEVWDFSENNLKNVHGFDFGPCAGGNAFMSTAYLARWSGPIIESDDPYNPLSGSSPSGLLAKKHLQEALIIPDRAGLLDNDNIKQALMTYGAVYTSMYWNDSYYNFVDDSYYFSGSADSNHAVGIVGWDDNFDKNKFSPNPPGNGAFIIRNSWGTYWGDAGYFYISYYDSNIGKENFVFNHAEETLNYSHIYQYDPLGWTSSMGYGNDTAWFANVFTWDSSEPLAAVSFYTASLSSTYELYFYTGAASEPINGSLAGSKSGILPWPGYHTVTLDSPVPLSVGQRLSVVAKLETPGYVYPIPIEYVISGYNSQSSSSPGESYVSSDGLNWSDITSISWCQECNVCLKAFSKGADISHQTIMDLATKYYNDILDRAPEPGGAEWWTAEIEGIVSLGIDVKEGLTAAAKLFFNSEEYTHPYRDNNQFVTDLYQTFLNRAPDPDGFNFWLDYLAQGLARNMLITQFAYSDEFKSYIEGILGSGTRRPENNLVNDFYRGFLDRFPDRGGFNSWLALMRNAQCVGSPQQIRDLSCQIALGFVQSAEYGLRNRNNSQYVEDLYNGILRRGADPGGFAFWLNLLNSETYNHEQVLQYLVDSPEFQSRVQEVIDAGCLQ